MFGEARLSALLCFFVLTLASCTTPDLEPIPGSITYGGQPRTKLTKAPVGSIVPHRFTSGNSFVQETYVIEPDRSLRLIRRDYYDLPID
ncbi:hypothetical protein [Ensifer sp. MJa1]|uniref:hypothetical protein n=1 Tax=Ensifer sp. MJa1 TaxID=2919888 RepID=UPI00300A769C